MYRTILDIPETRADFWEFFKRHWGPLLAAGQLRVASSQHWGCMTANRICTIGIVAPGGNRVHSLFALHYKHVREHAQHDMCYRGTITQTQTI